MLAFGVNNMNDFSILAKIQKFKLTLRKRSFFPQYYRFKKKVTVLSLKFLFFEDMKMIMSATQP
jgi:hypothetical protein